jgi:hypothetical protein
MRLIHIVGECVTCVQMLPDPLLLSSGVPLAAGCMAWESRIVEWCN